MQLISFWATWYLNKCIKKKSSSSFCSLLFCFPFHTHTHTHTHTYRAPTWEGRRGSGRPAPPPGPPWCSCWTASAVQGCKGTVRPAEKPPAHWWSQHKGEGKATGCLYAQSTADGDYIYGWGQSEISCGFGVVNPELASHLDLTFFMTSKTWRDGWEEDRDRLSYLQLITICRFTGDINAQCRRGVNLHRRSTHRNVSISHQDRIGFWWRQLQNNISRLSHLSDKSESWHHRNSQTSFFKLHAKFQRCRNASLPDRASTSLPAFAQAYLCSSIFLVSSL